FKFVGRTAHHELAGRAPAKFDAGDLALVSAFGTEERVGASGERAVNGGRGPRGPPAVAPHVTTKQEKPRPATPFRQYAFPSTSAEPRPRPAQPSLRGFSNSLGATSQEILSSIRFNVQYWSRAFLVVNDNHGVMSINHQPWKNLEMKLLPPTQEERNRLS